MNAPHHDQRIMDLERRMAESEALIDGYPSRTDQKLIAIDRQNEAISEMIEVSGRFLNVAVTATTDHAKDPDAHS